MSRDSHTISRFKGVSLTDTVSNIPIENAIDALNVFADPGGNLSQFQQPTILMQTNLEALTTLSQIPISGSYPRLVFQSALSLFYSDFPYNLPPIIYTGSLIGSPGSRFDYAFCNSILFFANGTSGGWVLPPNGAFPGIDTIINKWGIVPPGVKPTLVTASTTWVRSSVTLQRTAGVLTVTFLIPHGGVAGDPCYIDDFDAPWPANMTGLSQINTATALSFTVLQPGLPDDGPYTRAQYLRGISATTGWEYGACYGNQDGDLLHWSSLGPLSLNTGPVVGPPTSNTQSPVILCPPSGDPQVNRMAFFRNQDGVVPGGGLWYLLDTDTLVPSGPWAGWGFYLDQTTDEELATSGQTAPYDNGVFPGGKYLSVWLDRLLVCGNPNDPAGVRFTGYDSINFGVPQMSWCQFNEIKLGQGQAEPMGMGLLRYGGMVFFATNGTMYVYRGTLNDITISAPTSLSFYAEQLPYNIGLFSHFTIQSTPAGLCWMDEAYNLRVMDNTGFYPPKEIVPQLSGLFRRITPDSRDIVSSQYISYLQHHWYVLSFPIDGSPINNMTVFVDLTADPAKNTGAWVVSHSISDLIWVSYADQTGHLIALQPGLTPPVPTYVSNLTEIPLIQPIIQGILFPPGIPLPSPNLPMPNAFWRGGYFGIRDEQGEDEFSQMKMFRYTRLGSSPTDVLGVQAYLVNGEQYSWEDPYLVAFDILNNCGSINQKSRCISPLITFPNDQLVSLNSLMVSWITVSVR